MDGYRGVKSRRLSCSPEKMKELIVTVNMELSIEWLYLTDD